MTDVFPDVASLPPRRDRSDDRKYVCGSQARGKQAHSKFVVGIATERKEKERARRTIINNAIYNCNF